jgi:hypothetical protein
MINERLKNLRIIIKDRSLLIDKEIGRPFSIPWRIWFEKRIDNSYTNLEREIYRMKISHAFREESIIMCQKEYHDRIEELMKNKVCIDGYHFNPECKCEVKLWKK